MLSRSSLTPGVLVAALALLLAGCDREAPDSAQEQGALAGDKASLAGSFDDSRAGTLMPAITVVDPGGEQLNLGALQGQPVLLNLWATWCAPCIVEMPQLDELAGELEGEVRVITVSQDLRGADLVVPFFAKHGYANLEPWLDPNNELGFKLESDVLPTTILYDAAGREVWRISGEYDWSGAAAREAILSGIGEKAR